MDQFINTAYAVTSQLFGSDSGIPWWAWAVVVVAVMWKKIFPERKTAEDRDAAMVAALTGGGKKDKKKKK
jgi:hypothetical protein